MSWIYIYATYIIIDPKPKSKGVTFHSAFRILNTEPSIGAYHQVWVHLAKHFQRRRFLEIDQPEKRMWLPCLFTNWGEIIILYEGSSKDACYQDSIYLAKRFRRRFFRNQPIRNKNCLWRPCLLTDRN